MKKNLFILSFCLLVQTYAQDQIKRFDLLRTDFIHEEGFQLRLADLNTQESWFKNQNIIFDFESLLELDFGEESSGIVGYENKLAIGFGYKMNLDGENSGYIIGQVAYINREEADNESPQNSGVFVGPKFIMEFGEAGKNYLSVGLNVGLNEEVRNNVHYVLRGKACIPNSKISLEGELNTYDFAKANIDGFNKTYMSCLYRVSRGAEVGVTLGNRRRKDGEFSHPMRDLFGGPGFTARITFLK